MKFINFNQNCISQIRISIQLIHSEIECLRRWKQFILCKYRLKICIKSLIHISHDDAIDISYSIADHFWNFLHRNFSVSIYLINLSFLNQFYCFKLYNVENQFKIYDKDRLNEIPSLNKLQISHHFIGVSNFKSIRVILLWFRTIFIK